MPSKLWFRFALWMLLVPVLVLIVNLKQAQTAPSDLTVFSLGSLLKPKNFVPERAPQKTFGSLDANQWNKMPVSNQRWFRGSNRVEASVLIFPDEKAARRFDRNYVGMHSLPPTSPFASPPVNGVHDNYSSNSTNARYIYNLLAVGRVYIVIEAVRDAGTKTNALSQQEFSSLVQSVKNKLISAAKAVPKS